MGAFLLTQKPGCYGFRFRFIVLAHPKGSLRSTASLPFVSLAFGDYHFTHKKGGVPRDPKDIIRRGYLLPYIRDILERTGKPVEHTIENKNESYSIAGKANIKGIDKGIKIIVSRHTDGKYF